MPGEHGLLPCPFCGSEALHDFSFAGPREVTVYHVKCCNCECTTRHHATESGAAETWNRRAIPVEESQHVNQQAEPNMPEITSGESA